MNPQQTQNDDRPKLTEEQITSIYPTAKTYDEIREKRRLHDESLPKVNLSRLTLATMLRIYCLGALLVTCILAMPGIISWNPFAGVFIGFLFALIWLATAWWQLSELAKGFANASINLPVFASLYCIVAGLLISATFAFMWRTDSLATLGIATLLHVGICYMLMKLLISGSHTEDQA